MHLRDVMALMCARTCVCAYMCARTCVCAYMCARTCVCALMCARTCACALMCARTCACAGSKTWPQTGANLMECTAPVEGLVGAGARRLRPECTACGRWWRTVRPFWRVWLALWAVSFPRWPFRPAPPSLTPSHPSPPSLIPSLPSPPSLTLQFPLALLLPVPSLPHSLPLLRDRISTVTRVTVSTITK
jgi:hypothetical protein